MASCRERGVVLERVLLELERERRYLSRRGVGWEREGVDSNGWMLQTTAYVQNMVMRFFTVENFGTIKFK